MCFSPSSVLFSFVTVIFATPFLSALWGVRLVWRCDDFNKRFSVWGSITQLETLNGDLNSKLDCFYFPISPATPAELKGLLRTSYLSAYLRTWFQWIWESAKRCWSLNLLTYKFSRESAFSIMTVLHLPCYGSFCPDPYLLSIRTSESKKSFSAPNNICKLISVVKSFPSVSFIVNSSPSID